MTASIAISYGNAHTRLFLSILAIGNAAHAPLLAEGSIVIVHEEQARA